MDTYMATAILYELARAYEGMLTKSGYELDSQENEAMLVISKLLEKMENENGSELR